MAWTETTRARYERHSGRYASDLTDQEWGLIAPFLPPPKTTGRPRSTAMRDVLDAILYIASAGCAWRLPALFPGKAPTSPLSIGPEIGRCRGPQAPKTTQNFYKKARSAFLFFLFFLVQGWII